MGKKLLLVILLLSTTICFAQKQSTNNSSRAVTKTLDYDDSTHITELFFSGLREKIVQNPQQAGNYFKQIIEIDPKNDAALYELAGLDHQLNQEKEAENLLRQAIAIKPDNEWYWLLLADVYKKTNNLPPLNQVFDELIKLGPQKDEYYYDKATALIGQNKLDDALAVYNTIEKRHGLNDNLIKARQRIYQRQGKTDVANGELEKLVKSNPGDVRNAVELSQSYLKSGNTDKALQVLLEAKAADPRNGLVSIGLANVYRLQNKPAEAYAELKSAFENPSVDVNSKIFVILSSVPQFNDDRVREETTNLAAILAQVHPRNAKAQAVYGDILLQEKKLTEARAAYKKALALDDQDYGIWDNLLRTEIAMSDYDAAVKDGEESLTLFPSQAALYLYTGISYSQKKNYEKAISNLKNAASLETEDKDRQTQIYSGLGDAYNALKNYAESDKAYQKVLELNPDETYALNNFAYYLSVRGANLDKAEQMSRHSNELQPGNASFEDTYAWILFKQKKYKEARTWIEKSIKDDKAGSSVQIEHYGDILFHLGETELAVQQWTKAKASGLKSETLDRKINEKKYIE